jgi:molybdate transport system substrate-binding protein
MTRAPGLAVVLSALLVTALAGCGSSENDSDSSITVYAAASLRDTFTAIGEQYTAQHPGTSVEFNFAGSSDLVTQLTQGADADVFASADTRT